jgi:beta-lactamase regulating signal transducer with metallopeptidase domain
MLSLLVPFFGTSITGTSLWLVPVTDASVTLANEMGSRLSIEPVLQNLEPAKTVLQTENTMAIKTSQTAYFQLLKFYWQEILLAIYLLGVAYQLFFFLKGLKCIYSLISKNEKTKQSNYYLVSYQGNKGVFSFLNYLFWSKQIPDNELIKKHELTHISQKHSLDILFFELLNIVFWCNPIIRLYQKSMRLVHEYLADEAVTAQLSTKTTYTYALVAQATQGTKLSLLHHFSQSKPLKQRIMKIYQEKSKPQARRKYWLALPVIALCLFITACQKQDFQNDSQTYIKQEIPTHIPQDFQEKMKELQAQYPTYFFEYRPLYAAFMQRDLDEATENVNDEKIMFHRPISKQEYYNYEKGEHERAIAILIKEEGENSKIVQERKQYFSQLSSSYVIDQPRIGYIYMRKKPRFGSWDEEVEDLNAYTEVDEYPAPRDGANFYTEIFKLVSLPEYMKSFKTLDLQGDMLLEMVVNKNGNLVKVNLIEGIKITVPKDKESVKNWFIAFQEGRGQLPYEDFNGALFRAFTERSALRGWKAGVKNGKRVDTKIRFQISAEMVRKALF